MNPNTFSWLSAALVALALCAPAAQAQDQGAAAKKQVASTPTPPLTMTEGEVRKVDKAAKKITLKHGDIKNLDMPGMTMSFPVTNPAVLDTLQVGDKVRFSAEKSGGAIVVTDIQPVK